MDNSQELQNDIKDFMQSINLKDALNWILSSWDDITSSLITNCFKHSGFDFDIEENVSEDHLSEMSEVFAELQQNMSETLMT